MSGETFVFTPTGFEVERQKQAKQSVKQLAREFTKEYNISLRNATLGKQTTGGQLVNFKKTAQVCALYDQPVPDDLKCMIALYEQAEAEHIKQALWEEENPLARYPRPYREVTILGSPTKKKIRKTKVTL